MWHWANATLLAKCEWRAASGKWRGRDSDQDGLFCQVEGRRVRQRGVSKRTGDIAHGWRTTDGGGTGTKLHICHFALSTNYRAEPRAAQTNMLSVGWLRLLVWERRLELLSSSHGISRCFAAAQLRAGRRKVLCRGVILPAAPKHEGNATGCEQQVFQKIGHRNQLWSGNVFPNRSEHERFRQARPARSAERKDYGAGSSRALDSRRFSMRVRLI
jgi:hypothetical protein